MWHAGGANISADRERMGFFFSHCCGYLRSQECQELAVPRKIVRTMPRYLQRLLGWRNLNQGGPDFRDSLALLEDGQHVNPMSKTMEEGGPGWGRL